MMGFGSGMLDGTQNALSRQLARKYQLEADTENKRRWNLNYDLNRQTTESNIATAEQARDFAAQLQPHRVTAADLANVGTRQLITHRGEEHPYRIEGMDLSNKLSGQTYSQRQDIHPINLDTMRENLMRMKDDNAYMRKYRPGTLEAQRLDNERNQQILDQSEQLFGRQLTAADLANMQSYQAYEQAGELHPLNIANAMARNNLTLTQINRINAMQPWEIQQLQANINYLNAQTQSKLSGTAAEYKNFPTLLSNVETMGQAAMQRMPNFRKDGWFIFDKKLGSHDIFKTVQSSGQMLGASLHGSPLNLQQINEIASTYLLGIEKSKGYWDFINDTVGKDPKAYDAFAKQMYGGILNGILAGMGYPMQPGTLTPEQQADLEGALNSRGTPFNAKNAAIAAGGLTAVTTPLGLLPGPVGKASRAINPGRWAYKGGKRVLQTIPNASDIAKSINKNMRIKNARDTIIRIQNEMNKYGRTPKRVQEYQKAMDTLKKLEPPQNQPPVNMQNVYQGAAGRVDYFP